MRRSPSIINTTLIFVRHERLLFYSKIIYICVMDLLAEYTDASDEEPTVVSSNESNEEPTVVSSTESSECHGEF